MEYLDYLESIGNLLNFLGAAFLGWGLIRSRAQIIDEEATYYGHNPYKVRNGIRSQRPYWVGFVLTILGFSISLALSLNGLFVTSIGSQTTLLAITLSAIGILLLKLFTDDQTSSHLKFKGDHLYKMFIQQIYAIRFDEVLLKDKVALETRLNDLQGRYIEKMNDPEREKCSNLIENLKRVSQIKEEDKRLVETKALLDSSTCKRTST